MDPISIFSLIASVGGSADIVVRSISKLSQFRAKYREVPFIINILLGQLCTIQTALDQLERWSRNSVEVHPRYPELSRQLEDALTCFTPIITHLQDQLNLHDQEELSQLARRKSISFVWKEKDLNEHFQMLNAQVGALTLLLQALQCTSWKDQRKLSADPESKVILRSAKDCSSSIIALRDDASSQRTSSLIDNEDALSRCFEFDDVLLQSRIYTMTYRSHLKQIATQAFGRRQGLQISQSSSTAQTSFNTRPASRMTELPSTGLLTPPAETEPEQVRFENDNWSFTELPMPEYTAFSTSTLPPRLRQLSDRPNSKASPSLTISPIRKASPSKLQNRKYWYEGTSIKGNEGGYEDEYAMYLYNYAKFPILFHGRIHIPSERAVVWHSFVWAASSDSLNFTSELGGRTFGDVLGWIVNKRLKHGHEVLTRHYVAASSHGEDADIELALATTSGPYKNSMLDIRVGFTQKQHDELKKGSPPVMGTFDVDIHRSSLWSEHTSHSHQPEQIRARPFAAFANLDIDNHNPSSQILFGKRRWK